jgi:hypothetical protein
VDLGVFEEIARVDPAFEFVSAEEVVIAAVLFAGARRTGGAGNRVADFLLVREPTTKRGFARAGRPGNEEKNAGVVGHGMESGRRKKEPRIGRIMRIFFRSRRFAGFAVL